MRLPLLVLHISAGVLGLLSGAAAMIFRKGSPRHVLAGNIFVISMMTMATAAVYLAYMKHQTNNIFGGILTFYMVGTAWLTARRTDKNETKSPLDWLAFVFAFAIGSLSVIHGYQKAIGQIITNDGVPAGMDIFLGSVMLLAAAGDLRMIFRGCISGTQRIARHLWRICFGLFIASGSFFLGQAYKILPHWLVQTNVLFIPAILPLPLLVFWLIRVRFANAYARKPVSGLHNAYSLRT
jgi:hypothetical protein